MSEFTDVPSAASSGGLTEIQRNITSSLRFPPYGEDPAVFASPPTVTVTRDSDGTELTEVEATQVAATEDDIEHWVVEIKGTDIPEVDLLEVLWTDGSSSYTTYTEVVGGFVTSLRSIEKKLNESQPEEEFASAREIAIRSIEDACGVAFRRRYAKETLDGSGALELMLRRPRLIRVLSATIAGTELDNDELVVDPVGALISSSRWTEGRANVEVAYVHGHESFPPAALPVRDLAAYLLTPAPTDWNERATAYTSGEVTYSLVVAGLRGALFPLPSVNAFIEQHSYPTVG
jgi:hypothetical protein